MDCCFHNAPPGGCEQGTRCPVRLTERDLDRAIAESQMPGSIDPQGTYGCPTVQHYKRTTWQAFPDEMARWFEPAHEPERSFDPVRRDGHWVATGFALAAAVVGLVAILLHG